MDAFSRADLARQALLRLALVAMAFAALLLVGGFRPSLDEHDAQGTLKFSVECKRTGEGVEAVSCALVVTGLPDPLDSKVTVKIFQNDGSDSIPSGSAPGGTVVADEAPALVPGATLVLSRQPAAAPPSVPPAALAVPAPPPRAL